MSSLLFRILQKPRDARIAHIFVHIRLLAYTIDLEKYEDKTRNKNISGFENFIFILMNEIKFRYY